MLTKLHFVMACPAEFGNFSAAAIRYCAACGRTERKGNQGRVEQERPQGALYANRQKIQAKNGS